MSGRHLRSCRAGWRTPSAAATRAAAGESFLHGFPAARTTAGITAIAGALLAFRFLP
ncbi:MAG: hypothetical protein FJW09_08665 [Actinobacteria bacterium]|nr:hypothetical protein [Actinomycetota bacterium]